MRAWLLLFTIPACGGDDAGSTCEPVPTDANYVFVTSTTHAPDELGPADADRICNARAQAAGLPGTYVAWLSSSTEPARDRLGSARGWVRLDGLPFTDTLADLAAGKVFYPVGLDERCRPSTA